MWIFNRIISMYLFQIIIIILYFYSGTKKQIEKVTKLIKKKET